MGPRVDADADSVMGQVEIGISFKAIIVKKNVL